VLRKVLREQPKLRHPGGGFLFAAPSKRRSPWQTISGSEPFSCEQRDIDRADAKKGLAFADLGYVLVDVGRLFLGG